MSDDLVKRAEQMMLEMQQLGYEVWPSIIRDLLADRPETALDIRQADERVQALVDDVERLRDKVAVWKERYQPTMTDLMTDPETILDIDCTDCDGSGIMHQTERYCTCNMGQELILNALITKDTPK